MKRKNGITLLLFIGIAVLTYWTIFHNHDIGEILSLIRGMKWIYVIAAATVALLFVAAEGIMIWYLLPATKDRAEMMKCIKYSFIGFFFSGITPSATGGQPMQLFYMKKDGYDLADSTAVLMSVAVIYKLVLAATGVGLLIFWGDGLTTYLGNYRRLYDLGLLLNSMLVVILLGFMLTPVLLMKLLCWGEGKLVRIRILRPSAARLSGISGFIERYRDTVEVFKKNPKKIAAVIAGTFLQRCGMFFLTWLIYRGFRISGTGFLTIMMLRAAIYTAVDMLPLPGSQGITELMYVAVYQNIFGAEIIPAAVCVTRGIDFYFPLCVSAAVFLWNVVVEKRKLTIHGRLRGN